MRKELAIAITWATSLVALSLIKLAALQRGELEERTLREMDDLEKVEMISFAIVIIKTQVKKILCTFITKREWGNNLFIVNPFKDIVWTTVAYIVFHRLKSSYCDSALLIKCLKQEFESLPEVLRIDQWPEGLRLDITKKMRNTIHECEL